MKLSAYELSCGKVQTETIKDCFLFETRIELYKEHGVYHVRAFNYVKNSSSSDRKAWECFYLLNDARKYYKKLKKELK